MVNFIILAVLVALILFVLTFSRENWKSALILSISVGVLSVVWNYFTLPVLAWGFWRPLVQLAMTIIGGGIYGFILMDFDTYSYSCNDETGKKILIRNGVALGVVILFMIGAAFFSSEMINSEKYNQRLGNVEMVTDGEFNSDVHPIPINKMRSVDGALARKVAEDKLGEDALLASEILLQLSAPKIQEVK